MTAGRRRGDERAAGPSGAGHVRYGFLQHLVYVEGLHMLQ